MEPYKWHRRHGGRGVVRQLAGLRRTVARWRAGGQRIALVPTMGALHAGHLALVRLARRRQTRLIDNVAVP
ncbi:MAG: pantoate--beta-alanine ligase [Hyphomicrobiales bacterium]|nr:pantoate--beta-alanine ligase [Hyphomicrobiales bacterium]MBV8825257.1 pantoate--beta-alanine ligase [Hyphomicrobiales bacterium]